MECENKVKQVELIKSNGMIDLGLFGVDWFEEEYIMKTFHDSMVKDNNVLISTERILR